MNKLEKTTVGVAPGAKLPKRSKTVTVKLNGTPAIALAGALNTNRPATAGVTVTLVVTGVIAVPVKVRVCVAAVNSVTALANVCVPESLGWKLYVTGFIW